jgi:hypothetical membrane protein
MPAIEHPIDLSNAEETPMTLDPMEYAGRNEINKWLTLGGVVGPIMFVLAFTVAGALRAEYSPIHQAISDLGVGPNPWLLNGPMIIMGLLLVAFAVGFFRSAEIKIGSRWRRFCAVLLALPGLGYINAGVFTEAPATVTLHWAIGMPMIAIGSVVGFFVVGLKLRSDSRWRRLSRYSMVAGPATLVIIVAMFWVFTPGTSLAPLRLGGLMERVLFLEILAWYVVFGWRLSHGPRAEAK